MVERKFEENEKMIIKECIILGGGNSISNGISLGLKNRIKDKLVLGCNYSFKHFDLTTLLFCDKDFYLPMYAKHDKTNPDIYEELKNLPLIIGAKKNPDLDQFIYPNTTMIACPKKELGKIPVLTGLFALAIAEKLNPERIFLLGFDWNRRDPKTIPTGKNYNPNSDLDIHYYGKELKHRGSGYMGFYENHNPSNYFRYFEKSKSQIFNVSINSNIEDFKKITYSEFYTLLSNQIFNQDELRNYIKDKIK